MATNQPPSIANATDIRDIAPPVEIANAWAWLWWGLAALAVGIASLLLWRWWRKRAMQVPVIPAVPAHDRAKQKLQEALALIAQPKPFVTAVSDAERWYLEERFNFRAPERTTEEFLHELKRTDRLTRDQKESLGEFLTNCDLVKFAKYEPGEPELRNLHASALRLVEETQPLPLLETTIKQSEQPSTPPDSPALGSKTVDDALKSADWIANALKSSGYRADFSPESLWEIDRFFDEQATNGKPKPNSLLAADLGQRIFALGAYVGEVIRRNNGGKWVANDSDSQAEINIELHLVNGTKCWPVQRAIKRFKNGAEDGIAAWGAAAGLQTDNKKGMAK